MKRGAYEFVFPMVVGPRYIPGQPKVRNEGTDLRRTRLRFPMRRESHRRWLRPGFRSGHDVSLDIQLDAGITH